MKSRKNTDQFPEQKKAHRILAPVRSNGKKSFCCAVHHRGQHSFSHVEPLSVCRRVVH